MTRLTADWLQTAAAQGVCAMLTNAGYQAWFVGGCVRNALIGAPVADIDLTTDAPPAMVMTLANDAGFKAIPTGVDHGTVTVIAHDTMIEITTFRRDVATDGRRAVIAFADNVTDDARRRDFTMNALYAAPDGTLADPLGGLPDLQARCVRFIEDADKRIKEDYLRILRFFRFHAWYGDPDAGLDADGLAACADNIDGLASLSRERVGQEMYKLLSAPNPAMAVAAMAATGALAQILPGAEAGSLAVLVHLEEIHDLAPDPIRRLAVIGGQGAAERLRLSNADAARLDVMTAGLSLAKAAYTHGAIVAIDALAVRCASLGQDLNPDDIAFAGFAAQQVFPLTAQDLMPNITGAALGKALKDAKEKWISSGFTLTKADLLG